MSQRYDNQSAAAWYNGREDAKQEPQPERPGVIR